MRGCVCTAISLFLRKRWVGGGVVLMRQWGLLQMGWLDCEVPSACPIVCVCAFSTQQKSHATPAAQTSSTTRSRPLHDKVTLPEIESHLCCDTLLSREDRLKKKKMELRQDSDRQSGDGAGAGVGWGGWIKRTPEITKAFEGQVQYRGRRREYRVGELEMKEEDLRKWQRTKGSERILDSYLFS